MREKLSCLILTQVNLDSLLCWLPILSSFSFFSIIYLCLSLSPLLFLLMILLLHIDLHDLIFVLLSHGSLLWRSWLCQ